MNLLTRLLVCFVTLIDFHLRQSNTPPLEKEGDQQEIINVFRQYNIDSFLTPTTEIEFDSELHTITYKNGELKYEPKNNRLLHTKRFHF